MMRPESFGNKYLDSLANEFIPRIAKEGLNPFVYKNDLSVFVNHDHRIRRRIEYQTELLFGLLALSDVECNAVHSSRLTVGVKLDVAACGHPAYLPIW